MSIQAQTATVLRSPRCAGVGAACGATVGGQRWLLIQGFKEHLKSQTLQVMRFWWPQKSSKLKLDMQKDQTNAETKNLLMKIQEDPMKTLQNCRWQAKHSTSIHINPHHSIMSASLFFPSVKCRLWAHGFQRHPSARLSWAWSGQRMCSHRLETPKPIFRNQNVHLFGAKSRVFSPHLDFSIYLSIHTYIPFHSIPFHYITLHYITLHYVYVCIYIYVCIYMHTSRWGTCVLDHSDMGTEWHVSDHSASYAQSSLRQPQNARNLRS